MIKSILFFGLFSTAIFAKAGTIDFKATNGKIEFSAVGKPAMIKIKGVGQGPSGKLTYTGDKVSGALSVDLNKLTTEIDLRDEHMKNKYLEVKKFPTAELAFNEFKTSVPVDSLTAAGTEIPFTATFTLHGKPKPVSGVANLKKVGKTVIGDAEFSIKIMEYLDTLPSYAGIKLAEDVKLKVQFKGLIQ
jgi:polyisoprenoid-binding protein YceI